MNDWTLGLINNRRNFRRAVKYMLAGIIGLWLVVGVIAAVTILFGGWGILFLVVTVAGAGIGWALT